MAWESYTAQGALKSGTVTTLGWEIVDRKIASGAQLVFDLDTTRYDSFQIVINGYNGVNQTGFKSNYSIDGGSTWLTGYAQNGIRQRSDESVVATTQDANATDMDITFTGISTTAGHGFNGIITLFDLGGTNIAYQLTNIHMTPNAAGPPAWMQSSGQRLNTIPAGPINAIRYFAASGNMARGTFTLLGLPKVITTPVVHKPNGWEVIEQRSHSGSQFMEFNDFAGFGDLQIICRDIQCTTANVGLQFQVSTDGGSSFLTTASYVQGGIYQRFGQAVNNYTAAVNTAFSLGGEFSQSGYLANSNRGGFYDIRLSQLADRTSYTVFGKYPDNNGGEMTMINQCGHLSGSIGVVNAFRIGPNLGTMSGKFTLLGLADF